MKGNCAVSCGAQLEDAVSKEDARRRFLEWAESLPELEPCDFCGRVFLAGWCCKAAQENGGIKKKKEKDDVLPE
jgi:hypothetical protein